MSAQINLYHSRFRKVEDWLNLGNLLLATVVVTLLLGGWAVYAHHQAALQQSEAAAVSSELEALKATVEEATRKSTQPADPRLLAEVSHAEAVLKHRGEIVRLLESGAVGNSGGFSEFFRGFARQTPPGLWLTGFTLGAGGNDMEIRGSCYDEKIVPDYIRRLGGEKIFQGRQFSALSLHRDAVAENRATDDAEATATTVSPAPSSPARPLASRSRAVHFVLTPTPVAEPEAKK